jgi:serine/threonine protein kinase
MSGDPPRDDPTQFLPGASAPREPTTPPLGPAPRRGPLQPGSILNDTYRIERFISQGGMGEVHEGVHTISGDRVAIKAILPHLAEDELVERMFHKEAAALRKIRDPAIVRYENIMRDRTLGVLYLAMEYVDGESLADRLARQPLEEGEALALLDRLAKALDAAHHARHPQTNEPAPIYHRDVTPDNVILRNGRIAEAVLIDFGIAKDAKLAEGTVIGAGFAGKFGFVAPEQLGDFDGEIGPWTDVYSLALTIAAAVRGKVVSMGATIVDAIDRRRAGINLVDVPSGLRPLLESMLTPDPAHRVRSMAEVREGLATVLATKAPVPVMDEPAVPARPAVSLADRARKAWAPLAVAAQDLWAKAVALPNRNVILGGAGVVAVVGLTALVLLGPWSGGDKAVPPPTGPGDEPAAVISDPPQTPPGQPTTPVVERPAAPPPSSPSPEEVRTALLKDVRAATEAWRCSWLDFAIVDGALAVSGFALDPAGRIREVEQLAGQSGVPVSRRSVSSLTNFTPKACDVVDAFRSVKAAPGSGYRLSLASAKEFRIANIGRGKEAAEIVPTDFSYAPRNERRQYVILQPSGDVIWINRKAEVSATTPDFTWDASQALVVFSLRYGLVAADRVWPPGTLQGTPNFLANNSALATALAGLPRARANALGVVIDIKPKR